MLYGNTQNPIEILDMSLTTTDPVGSEPESLVYPFGPYEIVILLSPSGEFRQVTEVRISKDFLNLQQRSASLKYHDVAAFYEQ